MTRLNVGVDWGHEHAQFVAESAAGELLWKRRCEVKGSELDGVVDQLRKLAKDQGVGVVAVGIERKSGRLVDRFMGAGFEVWLVQPAQVDDARKLLFSSPAKDDLRDAKTIAWMLRSMPEGLSRVVSPSVVEVELQRLTRMRTDIVGQSTAVLSQVIELLRDVFPEILEVADPGARWFTALWRLVRTPERARTITVDEVAGILRKHRVRKITAAKVVETLRRSEVAAAHGNWSLEVELMLERLELLERQIGRLEAACSERLEAMRAAQAQTEDVTDVDIVQSLPGVGDILAPVLIGERLPRLLMADLETARALAGVAPVHRVTGKAQTRGGGHVGMRYACNPHLRRALHLAIEKGMLRDPWMKERYASLKGRGHTHGRACRQMADGLLHRLRAMLRDRTLYKATPPRGPASGG